MACPPILTGDRFLARVIDHIDCQAQTIGTFGYQSLAAPGSTAWTVMTGLLTVFIALFAIRLLFGPTPSARDLVFDVLKIGIVLTLAFSWLAFRPLAYDLTLKGPAEMASALSGTSTPDTGRGFTERLQRIDSMIVEMTVLGTGRTE